MSQCIFKSAQLALHASNFSPRSLGRGLRLLVKKAKRNIYCSTLVRVHCGRFLTVLHHVLFLRIHLSTLGLAEGTLTVLEDAVFRVAPGLICCDIATAAQQMALLSCKEQRNRELSDADS